MTYLENKKIFLALVDEYAPNNQYFTTDEDIRDKCAHLYAPAYQELANERTSLKTKTIEIKQVDSSTYGYEAYSVPKNKQIKRVVVLDENNNITSGDYYFLGEKIYVSNSKSAQFVIEYVPFLTLIDESTEDDFELEIDQDLQGILPYIVAADLLKTDPSADYTAFEKRFEKMMKKLVISKKAVSVNITEGEL